jgi:hypothetical protein
MPIANDAGRGHLRAGLEQIDRGIESFARPFARQDNGCGKVREDMHRGRVGQIVRRHVDSLDRSDGSGMSIGDALLETR